MNICLQFRNNTTKFRAQAIDDEMRRERKREMQL